jgi:integrating conjugative element protein (TIGR03761 family)
MSTDVISTQPLIPSPLPMGGPTFATDKESPFPDGYSITGERDALADLLNSDRDDVELDPRWPRVIELERREKQLQERMRSYDHRKGVDTLISDAEAAGFRQMGRLVDEEEDYMILHTLEAYRLFSGRSTSPDATAYAIPGGRRQAGVLKTLFELTANNNPYAEWGLLLHEQLHRRVHKQISDWIEQAEGRFAAMRDRGIGIHLQVSAQPVRVALGYKSPYGYAISELCVEYDRFVRYVRTLERKNQLNSSNAYTRIREVTRAIRYAWIELARFGRYLSTDEMRPLSRADFLPSADAEGQKRALAAQTMFPGIPQAIFMGDTSPQHLRKRLPHANDQVRAMLKDAALRLDLAAQPALEQPSHLSPVPSEESAALAPSPATKPKKAKKAVQNA